MLNGDREAQPGAKEMGTEQSVSWKYLEETAA